MEATLARSMKRGAGLAQWKPQCSRRAGVAGAVVRAARSSALPAARPHRGPAPSFAATATAVIEAPAAVAAAASGPAAASSGALVPVTFAITLQTTFGEGVRVVGSAPEIGGWSPSDALALSWTDGHVWTATAHIAPGQTLEFKFIRVAPNASPSWEPGANRSADVTTNTTAVTITAPVWGDAASTEVSAAAAAAGAAAAAAATEEAAAAASAAAAAAAAAAEAEAAKLREELQSLKAELDTWKDQATNLAAQLGAKATKKAEERSKSATAAATAPATAPAPGAAAAAAPAASPAADKPAPPAVASAAAAAAAAPHLRRAGSRGTSASVSAAGGLTRSPTGRRSSRRTSMSVDAEAAVDEYLGSNNVQSYFKGMALAAIRSVGAWEPGMDRNLGSFSTAWKDFKDRWGSGDVTKYKGTLTTGPKLLEAAASDARLSAQLLWALEALADGCPQLAASLGRAGIATGPDGDLAELRADGEGEGQWCVKLLAAAQKRAVADGRAPK